MASERAVIGISCCLRTIGTEPAHAVVDRYARAAQRHGDVSALLIPALPDLTDFYAVVGRLDAVMLTGSPSNLHPSHYGMPGDGEAPFDPGRDAAVMQTVAAALRLRKPVFGICRGLQELNAALGGTLRSGLGAADRPLSHHAPADVSFGAMFAHRHSVNLTRSGVLFRAHGKEQLSVNSVHFQGIDCLAPGLRAEAVAGDGLIEAVSGRPQGTPVLGVQWHPEWDADDDPAARIFFQMLGRAASGDYSAFGDAS